MPGRNTVQTPVLAPSHQFFAGPWFQWLSRWRDRLPRFSRKTSVPRLAFRRAEPLFCAFDILWDEHAKSDDEEEMRRFRNGEDLRYLPLIDRKLRLHAVMPKRSERLLTALTKHPISFRFAHFALRKTVEKEIDQSNATVPGDNKIGSRVSWWFAGSARYPSYPSGIT